MRVSDYEILYDLPRGEYDGRGQEGVRTVTVRAGRSLEVMAFPRVPLTAEAKREARERRSRPSMVKLNDRNRERHIMRLLEMNFTPRALVVTGTYAYPSEDYSMCNLRELSDEYDRRALPWDDIRVRKDVRNFIAKLRRIVTKAAKGNAGAERPKGRRACTSGCAARSQRPSEATGAGRELRWIVRIEEGKQPPAEGLPRKYHFHAIVEGPGLTREAVERCWVPHGMTTIEHFNLRDDGAKRLAVYLNKQKSAGRWWSHSRNLKMPVPTVSDRKLSRRRLAMIAADVKKNSRAIFEKIYPGYKLVEEPDVKYSDFIAGAYIYARLRLRD